MAKSKDYNEGYYWGKKAIKNNYSAYDNRSAKAIRTCQRYANDKKLTKTKKGKPLTASGREFYRGVADGMQDGYIDK